jgi:hypothetical protein
MTRLAIILALVVMGGCHEDEGENSRPREEVGTHVIRGSFEAWALPDGTKCVTNRWEGGVACDFSNSWKPAKKYAPLTDMRRTCKAADRYDGGFVVICTPPRGGDKGI